jgi:hypothetical protein
MPLYHFHVCDGERFKDPEGVDLPNDPAACEEAARIIRQLKEQSHNNWDGWTIVIMEGDRRVEQISFCGIPAFLNSRR